MSLATIFRFQFGHADAIRQVAANRNSIIAGVVLVLITAIARNYDQTFFGGSLFWLIGPLIFSFCSGSFLFLVLYRGFIRRQIADPQNISTGQQWLCFMSVFWMTAPIAWLYALPVERSLDSYQATQANLALLGMVSIWRVLLMARILAVLQEMPFIRTLGWVLVAASLETLIIGFFPAFDRALMASMGGMRNSPEEDLMLTALSNILAVALVVLVIAVLGLAVFRFRQPVRAFPSGIRRPIPVLSLIVIAFAWMAVAIPSQFEQQRFVTHAAMIEAGNYRESVEFLGRHSSKDFPASRRLEPNPYEYRAFEQLPKVIAALRAGDAKWIRALYTNHMDALFSHRYMRSEPADMTKMLLSLEQLPEGSEWISRNRENLVKVNRMIYRPSDSSDAEQITATHEHTNVLRRLGIDLSQKDKGEN